MDSAVTLTEGDIQRSINSLLRRMHLTAEHHVYAAINDNDELWRTHEGRFACPICGHHL